jgi:K+-sensing histidine kinase KdpD
MSGSHVKSGGSYDASLRLAGRWPDDGAHLVRQVRDGRLDALAAFAADAIVLRDLTGGRLFANQRAATVLGFSSVQALASLPERQLADRFAVEDLDGRPSDLPPFSGHEAFGGASVPDRVLRFRGPGTGWDRWISVRARPFTVESRNFLAVLHLLEDVTDQRRQASNVRFLGDASRRLSRALERARILEHASVVAVPRLGDECLIVERSEAGGFLPLSWYLPGGEGEGEADERARRLLRAALPALVSARTQRRAVLVGDPFGPGDGSACGSMVVAPICDGAEVLETVVLAMAVDTGRVHHPTDVLLAEEFAGLVASALGNARRLESEQRRTRLTEEREAAAHRVAGQRERVLHIVGQELNRPLERLVAASELLGGESAQERMLVDILQRQSQQLQAMVADLLETSALGAGQAPVERKVASVREILEQAVNGGDSVTELGLHDLWLEVRERLLVLGDEQRLVRVFNTLIATARSYAPPGSGIRIRATSLDGAYVDVTVKDERARTADEPLDEVLEQFADDPESTIRRAPGQALALTCAARIVERHDGNLWALSPSSQTGASFRVRLPLAFRHPAGPARAGRGPR